MFRCPRHSSLRMNHTLHSSRGSALLAMMLVLVVSASYVLVSQLNDSNREIQRRGDSVQVLNEAKAALIGYAISYPEIVDPNFGPGYLPCPDLDNDGDAENTCAQAGPTNFSTGRFPFETLNVRELRDSSNETLWYAVSDNYRGDILAGQLVPLNSETAGQLSVDGNGDIVAIIFSPGYVVSGQDRDPLTAEVTDVTNYLEGENAIINNGTYVTTAAGNFNDTLVTITRQELMQAVEARVLGDVSQAINNYQGAHAAYPWLSAFANPTASTYRGQQGTFRGHLPFHWSNDPDSVQVPGSLDIVGRNPFTSDITVTWSFSNANSPNPAQSQYGNFSGFDLYRGSMVTPDSACIQSNVCADPNYPGISTAAPITFNNAQCTWSSVDVFQCTGTFVTSDTTAFPEVNTVPDFAYAWNTGDDEVILKWDNGTWQSDGSFLGRANATGWNMGTQVLYAYNETVTRTYTINITFTDDTADGADIINPTAATQRTRNLELENFDIALTPGQGTALHTPGANAISIIIDETREIEVTGSPTVPSPVISVSSSRTLTNDADTKGVITATGIPYDVDIDAGELPAWFVQNDWHELIYLSYASGENLPGDTTVGQDCVTLVTNCISVDDGGTNPATADGAVVTTNVRAVALSAGIDTSGSRPSANLADYFEVDNAVVDDIFMKDSTVNNNDQLRVIATAP